MTIKHTVDSAEIDSMTLDKLQEFIDECRSVGIKGTDKIRLIGKSEGYHFTGTYSFTPKKVRAGAVPHGEG